MAIVTLGGMVAEARGSIGGVTFSRNRGGAYARNRTVPVDPGTTYQVAVRTLMSQLSNLWINTLTASQRAAWDAYADAVHLPNSLGNYRNVGGIAMYCRSNVPILQIAGTRVDDAPTIFDLGDYTAPAVGTVSASADTMDLAFTNADDWANEDDAFMLVYISRPMNPTRNFFKGPYRLAGAVLGNATTPPTSPQNFNLPFPVEAGHRVFAQVRVARADGRVSSPFRDNGTAS